MRNIKDIHAPRNGAKGKNRERKDTSDKVFALGKLIGPFIILAFVPVVGWMIATIGFIALGLASIADYMAEHKGKKEYKEGKKNEEELPLIGNGNLQMRTGPENTKDKTQGKNQDGLKARKRVVSLEGKKEETPCDAIKTEPKFAFGSNDEKRERAKAKTSFSFRHCLPGSSWLEEDRKRRRTKAANEDMILDNPASEPLSELSEGEEFYEKKEYDLSGYQSFPDIEEDSDSEKEEETQKSGIRTRGLRMGGKE